MDESNPDVNSESGLNASSIPSPPSPSVSTSLLTAMVADDRPSSALSAIMRH